jgi:hypothetical protein
MNDYTLYGSSRHNSIGFLFIDKKNIFIHSGTIKNFTQGGIRTHDCTDSFIQDVHIKDIYTEDSVYDIYCVKSTWSETCSPEEYSDIQSLLN